MWPTSSAKCLLDPQQQQQHGKVWQGVRKASGAVPVAFGNFRQLSHSGPRIKVIIPFPQCFFIRGPQGPDTGKIQAQIVK